MSMLSLGAFLSVNICVLFVHHFSLYAKLKKEEEEREAEWAKKYRDRVSCTLQHTSVNRWYIVYIVFFITSLIPRTLY